MEHQHHFVGLNNSQVLESRANSGANVLTPPEKEPLWKKFLEKFTDPLIIILLIAGVLSIGISFYEFFGLKETFAVFFEPIGIFIAVLLATGLAFIFELRADRQFSILNQVNDDEPVKVIRDGNAIEIPKKDVVVGDIVIINTGDEIPADGELLEAVTLNVDESTLTGEPLCHKSIDEEDFVKDATYPTNHVLRGTKVMEGHGVFKTTSVGDATENGKVFQEAQIDDSVKTPLNEQLDGLSDLITKLSYGFAALIIFGKIFVYFHFSPLTLITLVPVAIFFWLLISNKFEKFKAFWKVITIILAVASVMGCVMLAHIILLPGAEISSLLAYAMQTIMIAVTLIVVAVPEGLPMAVTLSLAYSMSSMLKTNNLVRKMHACETMGAATVICTDKTGTLTQNQMRIFETQFYGLKSNLLGNDEMSKLITEGIAVNSTAVLDLSSTTPKVLGNPTEGALLLWLYSHHIDYESIKEKVTLIEELPFSTERKYMATVVKSSVNGKKIIYVKGAPEIVYALCKSTCENVSQREISAELINYQEKAMRTLGFAYQILDDKDITIIDNKVVASNLQFMGIVAISDPVREDVPAAVKECLDAGIQVKIVTGDTPGTAKEIGRQIGLWTDRDNDENIIMGPELSALSDTKLQARVMNIKIISRARPSDKRRLVEALQAKNQVVAVTGDGTNDAPALNAAHVGLSMGDGTSVAKEASDITIIDNSFASIGRAVMWGRSLYKNIQRFLLFQLTVNVSACFIVVIGAFMGVQSPLTVTQMLWVNLIMDTFGAMALASLPPTRSVMKDKPRDRKAFIIDKPMALNVFGIGGLFFLLLLALLFIFQHADITTVSDFLYLHLGKASSVTPYEQTLLFSFFVWTHFWYMFDARAYQTGKSALNLKGCTGFGWIALIIVVGQLLIVEVGYDFFNVQPMLHSQGANFWDWLPNPSGCFDWIVIVIITSLVLWIPELFRLFRKR